MSGTAHVADTMRNIGHAARGAEMSAFNSPFFNFGEYCPQCQRWYNPSSPHVCESKLQDKITERKKIVRWLGDRLATVHDK